MIPLLSYVQLLNTLELERGRLMSVNLPLKKYLGGRAVTSPWEIEGDYAGEFSAAVVIPALAERETLPVTLAGLNSNSSEYLQQTLVVVVVNNRQGAAERVVAENRLTLDWLRSLPFPRLKLVWIDASSTRLALGDKDGVGLARKIGFDASLSLLNWSNDPLLISLDADTSVEENYLEAIFFHFRDEPSAGAAIPFRHQSGETLAQEQAIRRYELYLRSYLFGLQLAGSPYAYHAIGSAFACRAAGYIKAGGMNCRCGGEDFYFLQQLAKVSGVELLQGTVVRPLPRFSERVSFGTGRVVAGEVAGQAQLYQFIPAGSFKLLKRWLRLVEGNLDKSPDVIITAANKISADLDMFLKQLDFCSFWSKMQRNHSGEEQRLAAFHVWFDALRTRQLLSRLADKEPIAAESAVAELLDWGGYHNVNDCSQQLELLEQLHAAGSLE